jgi:hypothetical protein
VASGVSWEYRLALFCGLGPTIMGTVALVGWLVSHYGGFEALGMLRSSAASGYSRSD